MGRKRPYTYSTVRPIDPDMWKEDELTAQGSITTSQGNPAGAPAEPEVSASTTGHATLGQTVVITGELRADEDLTIEGQIDGTIESKLHSVTIGQTGLANAEILAKDVVVLGRVTGSIKASNKVEIWPNGSVQGDLVSPIVTIAEGATFRGSIDMPRAAAEASDRVAEQTTSTADASRTEETPRRLLETEIPVAAAGTLPQTPAGAKQDDARHAA